VNPVDYPRILRRRAWLIVLVAVIAAGVTAVISTRLTKVYEAKAVALVNPTQPVLPVPASDSQSLPSLDDVVQSYVQLIPTAPVRERLRAVGVPRSDAQLASSIHASREPNTTLIDVSDDDPDAQVAQTVATRIIPAFNDVLDQLQTSVQGASREGRLQALVAWELPALPTAPVSPHVLLNAVFALVAGSAVAAGLAVLLAVLDTTLRTEDDARERLGLHVLGSVPLLRGKRKQSAVAVETLTLTDPSGRVSESFRAIRTNLLFTAFEKELRTLVVTSAAVTEGKTTTACNLAVCMAQAGKRVVLVDADLHRPHIHSVMFGRSMAAGLSSLILGDHPEAEMILQSPMPNLGVVCGGLRPPNPSDLLGSAGMGRVLDYLASVADLVILDTPPLAAVSDAAILAAQVDGVVLVVSSSRTSCRAVTRARDQLSAVGATVLGVVLNKVKHSPYADYYHEYYAPEAAAANGSNGHRRSSITPVAPPPLVAPGPQRREDRE